MTVSLALLLLLLLHPRFSHGSVVGSVKGGYWLLDSGMEASDIDSSLFTHLYCAFAQLNNLTYQLSVSPQCASFVPTVRQNNPSVIALLSIGGGAIPSSVFDAMASLPSSRKAFIDSSLSLARSHSFHGLDLNWIGITTVSEMSHLATLLTDWRVAVKNESTHTGSPALILTAGLPYSPWVNPQTSFPAKVISASLDWVNLLDYDFHTPTNSPNLTRSHSALRDPSSDVSGSSGVRAWTSAGVAPEKLVLSFPYYGYAWRLVDDPNQHGLLAPADGPDTSLGSYVLRYSQIKQFINQRGATVEYDPTYVTNYCYSGTTWIGYDDTQSIAAKVSYIKTNGLLGYSAWHVAQDYNWALSTRARIEVGENKLNKRLILVKVLLPMGLITCLGSILIYFFRRRLFSCATIVTPGVRSFSTDSPDLRAFRFADICAATNNFSSYNKLGEGGFGPVYKGKLKKGQEIAVKRLSKASSQGFEEFRNEVMLTAGLQHVNLVKVIGFCMERDEQMLIYEYLPNKSLDLYLFDPLKRMQLDWEKRANIIEGIIQGLLYLQEYSRLTIIHRDLKTSNILLDKNLSPKISDFGMARIFQKDGHEANTSRIMGTYGYAPPEYVKHGVYSTKSDVYSFGVVLLQIISGKRNKYLYGVNEDLNLLEYAYELWKENRGMEFIEPTLDDSSSKYKLMRCLQIGLLCVQQKQEDRPSMLEVSSMFKNENEFIMIPKRPAFSIKIDEVAKHSPCSQPVDICPTNNSVISELEPR